MSKYGTWRELISTRSVLSFCQGARKLIALADASAPSSDSPVEAPVSTRIWYDRPAACSVFARSAMARGMAFAEPTGVKALNPTVCPCLIIAAASCAVRTGKGKCMKCRSQIESQGLGRKLAKSRRSSALSTGLFHLPGISQTLRTRLLTAHCRLTSALPG